MINIKREAQAIAPGREPEHLKVMLGNFVSAIDSAFPGKRIIWNDWDHARFDRLAGYLCTELGYSAGAPFLTAYGYTIVTDSGVICPEVEGEDRSGADPATECKAEAEASGASVPERGSKSQPSAGETRASEDIAVHTGRIVRVLGNRNSGFLRDDATGSDYYFNIRSFTQWADALAPGRAVTFRLARRFDRSHGCMRENAVELSYVD